MKPTIRMVKGNAKWNRGRIGNPFNPYSAPLRKSQRRTKNLKRQSWNRELRQKYGLRNKALLTPLIWEKLKRSIILAAEELKVEMNFASDTSPPFWPELTERVKRKLEAMK